MNLNASQSTLLHELLQQFESNYFELIWRMKQMNEANVQPQTEIIFRLGFSSTAFRLKQFLFASIFEWSIAIAFFFPTNSTLKQATD